MRTFCSIAPLLLGTVALGSIAHAQNNWLTGIVVEISNGHTDTGAVTSTTTNASLSGPVTAVDTGGVIVVSGGDQTTPATSTSVTTATEEQRTDYSIRADNKLFVVRPDPFVPKEGVKSKVARYTGWGWLQRQAIPITIPVNVGDKLDIAPFGDRAWVRYGNNRYACTVVRQVLLSPANETVASPARNADSQTTNPAPDPNTRQTLRREQ